MKWVYNQDNGTWIKELFAFDTWGASIVCLPVTSAIPATTLETDGEYHEFSFWLRRPKRGGHFFLRFLGKSYPKAGRFVYWQPDIESAEITKVEEGTGYLFNFGWKARDNMFKGQPA